MPMPNRTRLALSIWWRREWRGFQEGWPLAAPWVVCFFTLLACLLLMLASIFLLSPALGALVACVFNQPLPDMSGNTPYALDLQFCHAYMLEINTAGFLLAFWTLFWGKYLSNSEGAETLLGRMGEVFLVAIPGGVAFCWLVPAALIIGVAHLPRWTLRGARWLIPWFRGLGQRLRARQEQLIEDNPKIADELLKKHLNRTIGPAGGKQSPKTRL